MAILARTGFSKNTNSFKAGQESARMALQTITDPDLIILFASIVHNQEMMLQGVRSITGAARLIGGSAFGEMTNRGMNENSVALMAIKAGNIRFSLGLGNSSDTDPVKAGENAARDALKGAEGKEFQIGIFISEMLGSDMVLMGIQNVLGENIGLFGGCSSGNRRVSIKDPAFVTGYQYLDDTVYQHSIPLLLLSGDFTYTFGCGHGWEPIGEPVPIGRSEGNTIYEIDTMNALDYYRRYLKEKHFVHHPLGFFQDGHLILRAVRGIAEDNGLCFTTGFPQGIKIQMTRGRRVEILETTKKVTREALERFGGTKPDLAIIVSCISRRTVLGTRVNREIDIICNELGAEVPVIGFYCAGEYSPMAQGCNFYHNFSFCILLMGEETGRESEKTAIEVSESPVTHSYTVFLFSEDRNLFSQCKEALKEYDLEWVTDYPELEKSLEKSIHSTVLITMESAHLIREIKNIGEDIQVILLIKNEAGGEKEVSQDLRTDILGFCIAPFRKFELQLLVEKSVEMNSLRSEHRMLQERLHEMQEDINDAEDSLEITENVLTGYYKEIEKTTESLKKEIEERRQAEEALQEAHIDMEVKVKERTVELEKSNINLKKEITERKRAEEALRESEGFFRNIVENIPDMIFIKDAHELRFERFNKAGEELLGYSREELLGKNDYDFFKRTEADFFTEKDREVLHDKKLLDIPEEPIQTRLKGERILHTKKIPILDSQGNPKYLLGISEDITERRQAEEKIKASLEEKDMLLREIHHRVKNNLQVISSLLNIQANHIQEPRLREPFNESRNRVRAMALIHEKIYQSGELAYVEFGRYLQSLVTHLLNLYGRKDISFSLEADKVHLDIDTAIPCALIVNELVTNALKHAFPDGRVGAMRIELRTVNESSVVLSIRDDGIGFPEEIDFLNTQSLGLQLVCSLVEQVDGTIKLARDGGTSFTITFTPCNH